MGNEMGLLVFRADPPLCFYMEKLTKFFENEDTEIWHEEPRCKWLFSIQQVTSARSTPLVLSPILSKSEIKITAGVVTYHFRITSMARSWGMILGSAVRMMRKRGRVNREAVPNIDCRAFCNTIYIPTLRHRTCNPCQLLQELWGRTDIFST